MQADVRQSVRRVLCGAALTRPAAKFAEKYEQSILCEHALTYIVNKTQASH